MNKLFVISCCLLVLINFGFAELIAPPFPPIKEVLIVNDFFIPCSVEKTCLVSGLMF